MTHTLTTTVSKSMSAWKAKVLVILVLALLMSGHSVQAQTVSTEFLANLTPINTEPVDQPTVQDVLLKVCEDNGYGEDCAKTLLGMLWNESSNRSTVIGDNGQARGYFQIHYKMHKITTDCAEDLVCSSQWTINYMEAHSYPKYVSYAIQCHNSCNVNNGYAAKALRNAKLMWNRPLEIKQAAPITLAMN